MGFEELKVTRQYLNALEEAGITTPTAIQEKAIPSVRAGQDIIGIAQTGTGKTAAYLIPLMQTLKMAQSYEPRVLILVPTKELAVQVGNQFAQLAQYTDFRHIVLYGGVGPINQLDELSRGCDFIIATPGRFLELYSRGAIPVKKIKHVVLDEADRMMDMGFMPQLRRVQEVLPVKRQNLLFSATFPERVEKLSEEFLLFPTRIEVTPQATPVETVEQRVYMVPNFMTKLNLLMELLSDESLNKVIVFTRTKEQAIQIGRYLERKSMGGAELIHSNRAQNARMNAMNRFRAGEVRILVSTDLSARGIDIPEVSHVINFSIPKDHHDYVHRIGRTGRAFRTGVAISFCNSAELWHLKKIEEVIRMEIPRIKLPENLEIAETKRDERQEQDREIDTQKRRDDPTFKGAFHDRKRKFPPKKSGKSPRKR